MNSVASIVSPIGMTIIAGPGSTIMATPAARIVKPITIMISRLAWLIFLMMRCFKLYHQFRCSRE